MDYYQKNIEYFMNQHYQTERKTCVAQTKLFEDQFFKPESDSLFLNQHDSSSVSWKRPQVLKSFFIFALFLNRIKHINVLIQH